MKKLILFLLILGIPCFASAQEIDCATVTPTLEEAEISERNLRLFKENAQSRNGNDVTIPVVVHLFNLGEAVGTGDNITDAQIQSAITNINEAFSHSGYYDDGNHGVYSANIGINFALAQIAPDGSATNGIIRYNLSSQSWSGTYGSTGIKISASGVGVEPNDLKELSKWPNTDYLNIWLINKFEGATLHTNPIQYAGTTGFAFFPSVSYSEIDGVIMVARGFGFDTDHDTYTNMLFYNMRHNRTTVHEIGHYLNLYHTFEGSAFNSSTGEYLCPTASNGCGTGVGDCCGDISAHKRIASNDCIDDANGNTCHGGGPNPYIHNYMNYGAGSCVHGFSENQKTRMESVVASTGIRNGFQTSVATTAMSGSYPAAACDNTSGYVAGASCGPVSVSLNGTTWHSQVGLFENYEYLDRTRTRSGVSLDANTEYTISIGNTGSNAQRARVYIDYNNDGDFNDTNEHIGYISTQYNGVNSITFTTPSASDILDYQRVRLRVIVSFETITGPCPDLTHGQIEDYSVIINPPPLDDGPLPLDLLSFEATPQKDNIQLTWEVANSINVKGFEVERQTSGRGEYKSLQWIDFSEQNRYQFVDNTAIKNTTYYYRLKIIDSDHSFSYSPIKEASITQKDILSIYPNPVSDDGLLYITNNDHKELEIAIYNISGQLIQSPQLPTGSVTLNVSQLPKGTYYYRAYNYHILTQGTIIIP